MSEFIFYFPSLFLFVFLKTLHDSLIPFSIIFSRPIRDIFIEGTFLPRKFFSSFLVKMLMYAYGDDRDPLDETVKLLDEIVFEYVAILLRFARLQRGNKNRYMKKRKSKYITLNHGRFLPTFSTSFSSLQTSIWKKTSMESPLLFASFFSLLFTSCFNSKGNFLLTRAGFPANQLAFGNKCLFSFHLPHCLRVL